MDSNSLIDKLTREGRLQEARRAGEDAVAADPHDDAAIASLVSVYLEIESQCIATGVTRYLPDLDRRIDELIAQMSSGADKARSRHTRLQLSTLPGYAEISALEELSARDGHEREAYTAAREIVRSGRLASQFLEMYGTIISRYARVAMTAGVSRPVRELFYEYLGLPLTKPSRLHSLMLRMAVRCARKFPDFNFTRFFDLWDPHTFRPDDIMPADGKTSLAAAAFETVIDSDRPDEFPALLERVRATPAQRMAIVRRAFVSLVSRNTKEGDTGRAVDLLELYAAHHALHGADECHSRLLSLALRVMDGDEKWRFVRFLVSWDTHLLRAADFQPSALPDGTPVAPLATRALSRCFHAVRSDIERHASLLPDVAAAFDNAMAAAGGRPDELTLRRRSMLTLWMERGDEALERMSAIAREGSASAAFWLDFADMAPDSSMRRSILALGALRLDESRADGPDLDRLHSLLRSALPLDPSMAAEPAATYNTVRTDSRPAAGEILYHRLAADALAMIYSNVSTELYSAVDRRDNVIAAACATRPPLPVDTLLWPALGSLERGANIEVKRTATGIVMAREAGGEPYGALTPRYGLVTAPHVVQCGGVARPVACDSDASPGTFVKVRVYLDAEYIPRAVFIAAVPAVKAAGSFDHVTAAIWHTDNDTVTLTAGPRHPLFEAPVSLVRPGAAGELRRLYYYTDRTGKPHTVASRPLPDGTPCDAIGTGSGRLVLNPDGTATVNGDITVSESIVSGNGLPDNIYVTCRTLSSPSGRIALSATPYAD